MSFSDRESGVVSSHIARLERACKELNVFLFIRPTECDSTQLIGKGTLAAQQKLQAAVVRYGGGGSDIDSLEKWIDEHIDDIAVLCEGFGAVPGAASMEQEAGFLLKAIPGTQSYTRA